VRQALNDLKQTGFLSISDAYLEEPIYAKSANGRGRPTLKDVRWTLYPSNAFAEEIITGNAAMKQLRERLSANPCRTHQIPALDSSNSLPPFATKRGHSPIRFTYPVSPPLWWSRM